VAADVRSRLLDLAIASIEEGGEASIRVNHLAAAAGVTPPVVYYHFGSREGLVIAAQTARYAQHIRGVFEQFAAAVAACESAEALRSLLVAVWTRTFRDHTASRWTRLNALGSAYARPELEAAIFRVQDELFVAMAETLKPCQERGWLRADVDLATAIAWQHGLHLSRAFVERSPGTVDLDEWDRISLAALLHNAFGPQG